MELALLYPSTPFVISVAPQIAVLSDSYEKAMSTYARQALRERGLDLRFSPASGYRIILGLLYLSSILKDDGNTVKFYHQDYLTDLGQMDYAIKEIAESDCLFIASSTVQYNKAVGLINEVKKVNPNIVAGLMGREATFLDKELLTKTKCDIAIRWDGELTVRDLVSAFEKGQKLENVRGITWKENGKIRRNRDAESLSLDSLPAPDFGILPRGILEKANVSLATSRGCPYKCSYCYETFFWGNSRYRRMDKVMEDISLYLEYFPYDHVFFHDSTFTCNKRRTINFCSEFKRNFPDIYFSCNVRANTLGNEIISSMVKANCIGVFIGVENASDNILSKLDRFENRESVISVIRNLDKNFPLVVCSTIMGLPGETYTTAIQNIQLIRKLLQMGTFQVTTRVFTPYPGTPIFQDPKRYGMEILSHDFDRYDRYSFPPVIRLKSLNEFELYALFTVAFSLITEYATRRVDLFSNLHKDVLDRFKNIEKPNIYKIDYSSDQEVNIS